MFGMFSIPGIRSKDQQIHFKTGFTTDVYFYLSFFRTVTFTNLDLCQRVVNFESILTTFEANFFFKAAVAVVKTGSN